MRLAALFCLALLSASAFAASKPDSAQAPAVATMTPPQMLAWHDKLAQDLRGREYEYVNAAHLAEISNAQAEIQRLLEGKSSIDQLDPAQRKALDAANAEVLAALGDAKLDKKICRQQHAIGSRVPKLVCQSERERRELAERNKLDRLQSGACTEGSRVSCSGG